MLALVRPETKIKGIFHIFDVLNVFYQRLAEVGLVKTTSIQKEMNAQF